MYQKDYMLRLIEQFGEFLAIILSYIKKGNYKKASVTIQNTYRELLNKEAAEFLNLPNSELIEILETKHQFNHQQLEILGELFYAEAEMRKLKEEIPESKSLYQKALIIFEYLDKEQKIFSVERQ